MKIKLVIIKEETPKGEIYYWVKPKNKIIRFFTNVTNDIIYALCRTEEEAKEHIKKYEKGVFDEKEVT